MEMSRWEGDSDSDTVRWRRAYLIFEAALDLPAPQREVFVQRESGTDGPLLQMVQQLIEGADFDAVNEEDRQEQPLIGSRIGRYEIVARLGRGATGHVYSARDTELDRLVALKILGRNADGYGGMSPDSKRLLSEAKAASALNHPNIVTVFEVVRDGRLAIAMELIDGSSLREFCGAPQPVATVARWGRQIAQALAATHGRGIVHRDIKPENVMIRRDGYVKVLDFGLARRDRAPGAASGSSALGVLGGTLMYMSPEQTRGEHAKSPSDIFSLGIVLYELVCGEHPFGTASPIDTAYAIAHGTPKRPGAIPRELASLLLDMLAKEPADRPRADEVEFRLREFEQPERQQRRPIAWQGALRYVLGAVALATIATGAWYWRSRMLAPPSLVLEPLTRLMDRNLTAASVSPDGSSIAYAMQGGPLYLQRMSDGQTLTLKAPADLRATRLAWFADGKQLLVSGTSGPAGAPSLWKLTPDASNDECIRLPIEGRNAAPSPDGSRIALESNDSGSIWIAGSDGSHPRMIRTAAPNATFHSIVWSPDSKRISFMTRGQLSRTGSQFSFLFETVDATSGAVLASVDDLPMFSATALPDGRIICLPWAYRETSHGGELIEIRTNPQTGEFLGQTRKPMPYSTDGVFMSLSASSDGSKMALIRASDFVHVYAADVVMADGAVSALTNVRRLTAGLVQEYPQSWTADGASILFESNRSGRFGLYSLDLATRKETKVYEDPAGAVQPRVTSDGKWIIYRQGTDRHKCVLMRIAARGTTSAEPVPMNGALGEEQGCGLRPGSRCVTRAIEEGQFVVRELDPVLGKGRELARIPHAPYLIFDWSLSPDGQWMADPNHDGRNAQVRLTPLGEKPGVEARILTLAGLSNLSSVAWSADGAGFFGTSNLGTSGLLFYSDLNGRVRKLWESSKVTFIIPSPDGRHIAFPEFGSSSSIQLLRPARSRGDEASP